MRAGPGRGRQGRAGADHRDRQVVVEVGVHARQRELDRLDPRHGALLDQRPPRQRLRRRGASSAGGGEVQVRERHIQLGHERRVSEEALAEPAVHLPGHVQVHAVETRQPVCRRQRRRDRLQASDRPGNRDRRRVRNR
jgi:hypothetical protein